MLGAVGRAGDEELLALLADLDRAVLALLEIAARAGDAHDLGLDRHVDAGGQGDGLFSDTGHASVGYQICATSSPPTPSLRASWPVITPREVDTIAVPMPPSTFGIDFEST